MFNTAFKVSDINEIEIISHFVLLNVIIEISIRIRLIIALSYTASRMVKTEHCIAKNTLQMNSSYTEYNIMNII